MRVVVIGAGLGGLSAAAHLVGRGHDVLVLERGSAPGGRAGLLAQDGFRLQTGPTVLTMPELLAHTFAAAGAEMDRYVTIGRLAAEATAALDAIELEGGAREELIELAAYVTQREV